jgi:site-specific DNA-methyltransferase (adenine-specific)
MTAPPLEPSATFERDGHTVVHGDGVSHLSSLPAGSVDLAFVDPPYNIGKVFGDVKDKWPTDAAYVAWCQTWIDMLVEKMSPTGAVYMMTSTQAMPYLDVYLRDKLSVLSRIIWHYDSSGVQAKRYYGSLYEPILYAVVDPKAYTFNAEDILVEAKTGAERRLIDYRKAEPTEYASTKVPGNVWTIPRVRYRMHEYEEHPTQKPEALLERIILASSNPGDLVIDPFAGTFTASAVAQRLGRRSIGVEANEDYVGIGLRRLGLATEYRGKPLEPVVKSTARRNGTLRTAKPDSAALQMQLSKKPLS